VERRLVLGPALRACVLALLLAPAVVLLERALLADEGVVLAPGALARAVLLPGILSVLLTAAVFALIIGRHALRFRDAMRELAARNETPGAPEITKDVAGDLLGIRETFDDMRGQLDRALRRLAHADEQRRRLFADLAHELATPAMALLALGDTLGQSDVVLDDAERRRLTRSLEGETLRIARLVEDIRDLAELDDPDVSFVRERADLAAVIAGTIERLAGTDGAPIELEATPTYAEVDAMRVDQALTNLLRNARRYTPADRRIRVQVLARESSAVVVVEDGGPGVPAEALGRLGERLFRVDSGRDRRTGGHGLGLAIVRATMARHAGTTRFEAGESGGLRVTLTLPLAKDRSALAST
jgi:two-component system, OmpR family, sensor histidine kinase BaeS